MCTGRVYLGQSIYSLHAHNPGGGERAERSNLIGVSNEGGIYSFSSVHFSAEVIQMLRKLQRVMMRMLDEVEGGLLHRGGLDSAVFKSRGSYLTSPQGTRQKGLPAIPIPTYVQEWNFGSDPPYPSILDGDQLLMFQRLGTATQARLCEMIKTPREHVLTALQELALHFWQMV